MEADTPGSGVKGTCTFWETQNHSVLPAASGPRLEALPLNDIYPLEPDGATGASRSILGSHTHLVLV